MACSGRTAPGSFRELTSRLHDLSRLQTDTSSLTDCAFALSPGEFQKFCTLSYNLDLKLYDFHFDGFVLRFFPMSVLHFESSQGLTAAFYGAVDDQVCESDAAYHPLKEKYQLRQAELGQTDIEIIDKDGKASTSKPDGAIRFGTRENRVPGLLFEVNYHRRFRRVKLQEMYSKYLTKTRGRVRTVVCLDLFKDGELDDVDSVFNHLDDCWLAVWIADPDCPGEVITLVDCTPITTQRSVSLYMSDFIAAKESNITLPPHYIRPTPG